MALFPTRPRRRLRRKARATRFSPAHVNDIQDEIMAIEAGLLSGGLPITCSNISAGNLTLAGGSTMGTLSVSSQLHDRRDAHGQQDRVDVADAARA